MKRFKFIGAGTGITVGDVVTEEDLSTKFAYFGGVDRLLKLGTVEEVKEEAQIVTRTATVAGLDPRPSPIVKPNVTPPANPPAPPANPPAPEPQFAGHPLSFFKGKSDKEIDEVKGVGPEMLKQIKQALKDAEK